ncbi:Longevity-assurance protein, partial [Teladorsagia circumcincta]
NLSGYEDLDFPPLISIYVWKIMNSYGITEQMLEESSERGPRNALIGTYRIVQYQVQTAVKEPSSESSLAQPTTDAHRKLANRQLKNKSKTSFSTRLDWHVVLYGTGFVVDASSVIDTLFVIFDHLTGGFARQTRPKRILECFWRFSYYTFAFAYGCVVLWNKSWLWDVKQCWIGYPFHPVEDSVWWYYMIETSFYYSLLFGAFFDVKRSDFWEMIIHHIVTIGLLSTSFTINFVRAGTLVLISHDLADILLEFGKLTRYDRNLKTLTNACFVVFLTG